MWHHQSYTHQDAWESDWWSLGVWQYSMTSNVSRIYCWEQTWTLWITPDRTTPTPPLWCPIPPVSPRMLMWMNREMSPHAESESTPFDEIILASGCKLIVHGVGANKRNSDPIKIMQDAISQIQKANPDLASILVLVKPFPTLRADWTTSCYH